MSEPPSDSGNLGARARASVLWNTGIHLVTSVGQFGLMLVLVRILAPEIYGQFGLLMAVMGFLFVFSGQGVIDFALQERNDRDIPTSEIFIFAISTSVLLFVLANAVALGMRHFPKYAGIADLLHLMSFTFLLHPARGLRVVMLQRALDWRRIRLLHLSGFVVSAVFSISLAYAGAGIYALIISSFLVPLPYIADLFLVARWRAEFKWDFARFRPALTFGINRLMGTALAAGRRVLESTVIVQTLGFAPFGAYGRAISLSDILCTRLVNQTLEALYPAITKIETQSARFRRTSVLILRSCFWIVCPLAALMALLAEPMVRLLLGEQWLVVIPILPWAFALACATAIYQTLYRLLLGHKQQRHCLYLDSVGFVGVVLALVLLLPGGLERYLQGLVAIQIAVIFIATVWLIERGGIALDSLASVFAGPILPVGAAWFVFVQVGAGFEAFLPPHVLMAVQIVCYMSAYLLVLRLLFVRQLTEMVPYFPLEKPVRRLLALS